MDRGGLSLPGCIAADLMVRYETLFRGDLQNAKKRNHSASSHAFRLLVLDEEMQVDG